VLNINIILSTICVKLTPQKTCHYKKLSCRRETARWFVSLVH